MAKKSTLGKVREAVTEAAAVVAQAAETHVVKPVGKALGLAGEKKPAAKKATAKKPAAKPVAAKAATQKPAAMAAAKPKAKSPTARVMTKAVPPPAPKGQKAATTRGPARGR